ncbi:hypothetical protein GCM10010112_43620 [Actinoplanes lobatus]|uniref:Dihydrodipicolinate synthase/N-acetylneuraminate lyase n=1 Tax=Actinoplanes lobatus TaxID=113568 RepID=A0A7W7HBQ8_9ACTN|nr:hypothetical protein [Actinoplanes lobatus]MBB4747599.1 dihydrodipicolinate synthase/N-acetylneuraminate lyase [Actinoplanes lobatus]GGN73953.1 hypothetical protein GCM10010112_43620 [Actinoplanes lobatus]GIE39840.1 hypothetical protein Alo02nite_27380 [Actinoplanes lobatus]
MIVCVPALTPGAQGTIDTSALRPYINRAANTWVHSFLLSGSTTRGDLLTAKDKGSIIDIWLEQLPPGRIIACCWNSDDIKESSARGVRAMAVLQALPNENAALDFLASLPGGSYIYSHPMYTPTVFNTELATLAAKAGVLPAGGKVAKIGFSDITGIRNATGPEFALLDGSSRQIGKRIEAGASGVIATPLSHIPSPFPTADLPALQPVIDASQATLDALPDRPARTAHLLQAAFGS